MRNLFIYLSIAAIVYTSLGAMYLFQSASTSNLNDLTVKQNDVKNPLIAIVSNKGEVKSESTQSSTSNCVECHEEQVKSFQRTTHSKSWNSKELVTLCGNCHGNKLAEHLKDNTTATVQNMKKISSVEFSKVCLTCHEKVGEQKSAGLSEHTTAGVNCISCHEVHPSEQQKAKMGISGHSSMFREKPTELCLSCHKNTQAQFAQTTHHRLKEGVLECSNCHNPHGTANGKQLRADNKEVCVQCHQDKRGPFMFEHGAILSESGCITCHENHGGSGRNMLKARDPKTLCMSCHSREAIGQHGVSGIQYNNGVPTGGLTTAGDCTRCHSEIHGSNSSPFFHR